MFAACRDAGLAPERGPVPVAPAAHYVIGGILCDLNGRTTLPGLYAVGESSCTGVHGANRLASNCSPNAWYSGSAPPRLRRPSRMSDARRPCRSGASPPTSRTREAMWRLAGPRREASELERLLDDPYPCRG